MNTKGKGLNHEKGSLNHNYKHGLGGSRVYSSWANMVQRCTNPSNQDWKYYGGRGVTICFSLRNSAARLRDVIGDPPEGKTLNRIDSNGNYTCGKCFDCLEHGWVRNIEWADSLRQSRNRNLKRKLSLGGETHCITEWAEILGMKARTIRGRIDRGKTDPVDILAPADKRWTK